MCLYPRLLKNKKYTANKKNGGVIPAVNDERVLAVPIACGQCIECRKKKAREWQIRMLQEIKSEKNGKFVTLTFNNEEITQLYKEKEIKSLYGYEKDNKVAKLAVRRFLERWRKKNKKSVRHWLITELGHNGTENIHIHGIIWTDKTEEIEKTWKYGHVWIGDYVSERTVNYIIKYVTKIDKDHKHYQSKILTSAGIGGKYTETYNASRNKYKEGETREYIRTSTGNKMAMPIYYRNKIYTEEEREKLWIKKLNENIRYVNGIKIDISKNEEDYKKHLKEAQKQNERLGYGNGEFDWKEKQYEEQRRTLLQNKRMSKRRASSDPSSDGQATQKATYGLTSAWDSQP